MWFSILLSMFHADHDLKMEYGKATVYYPRDGHCGPRKADGKKFRSEDSHIATRYIPIRTRGVICNVRSRRCTRTVVRDRGPFGSILPCSEAKKGSKSLRPHRWNGKTFKVRKIKWRGKCYWYQVQPGKLRKGWAYRGKFDLTRPVAKAIGHKAFDEVVFIYSTVPKAKRYAFNDCSHN